VHLGAAAAQMLIFLQENEIRDTAGLEQKISAMHGKVQRVINDLKPVNRRIDTLKEHIRHSEHYKEHRSLKKQYDRLYAEYTAARKEKGFFAERKAQKALDTANDFYEFNRTGLALFDAADKYLRGVLQEKFDPKKLPPIKAWKQELGGKMSEKAVLDREYTALKEETQKVEQIRRSVGEILCGEKPKRSAKKRNRAYGYDI